MTANSRAGISRGDRTFEMVNYVLLALIALVVLYPLIYIVSCSFSEPSAVTAGEVWLLPVRFSTLGYETAFKHPDIVPSFINSIVITVLGTAVSVAVTLMFAYPLSRRQLYGRGPIMALLAFTMLFSGGLIPTFLLVRSLGMYNTYWALILPGAVSAYNVVVARTYFQTTIPEELHEAGELDGCSDIRFMVRIALPLAAPIIAVLVMFSAVGYWNSYFSALIYLKDKNLFPLQIVLRQMLIQNNSNDLNNLMIDAEQLARQQGLSELLKYSLIVIASAPMLAIYPFVQKHFVKGVMIGALKG